MDAEQRRGGSETNQGLCFLSIVALWSQLLTAEAGQARQGNECGEVQEVPGWAQQPERYL